MNSVAVSVEPMDAEAFLAFVEERPDQRWELVDGVPTMMAGGTIAHARLMRNVLRRLDDRARSRGCEAVNNVFVAADTFSVLEPDVLVRCGPISPKAVTVEDACVVVEVLSPSTIRKDRVQKFEIYRRMPSLRQLILVYQDRALVESWVREFGDWLPEPTILDRLDAEVTLPLLGSSITLGEIYEGVIGAA